MFRHKGRRRTYKHDLLLASLLSFIAGLVNISGVLSVKTLTTNVTGHFAYFAEELVNERYRNALLYVAFILFFLLGAFLSNFLIESVSRLNSAFSNSGPMTIEVLILTIVAFQRPPDTLTSANGHLIAFALLFAMGIQNSLVTQVSQSTVRTTHLTGLFTDLGIELSQLFFYRRPSDLKKLSRSIYLRLSIIFFFFSGCVTGGFLFHAFQLKTLLIAAAFLSAIFIYDNLRYRFYSFKRKYR